MAAHLKVVLLTYLLLLMVLMEEVKPVLATREERLKQRTKLLEESVRELKEKNGRTGRMDKRTERMQR